MANLYARIIARPEVAEYSSLEAYLYALDPLQISQSFHADSNASSVNQPIDAWKKLHSATQSESLIGCRELVSQLTEECSGLSIEIIAKKLLDYLK